MAPAKRPPGDAADTLPSDPPSSISSLPTLTPPTTPASAGGTVDLSASSFDEAARYQLGALLGQGGMGEVHQCRDARTGRHVALKRIRETGSPSSGPPARARFLREARIQAQLEHPAVVPVYDLGRGPDGAEYFTMKRVRGRTLQDVLDELRAGDNAEARGRSRRKLLTAFSSVCLAVHYAHARGVLHRDLKPANLMLGDFGEVYVLDWGLAKVAGEAEARVDSVETGPDPAGQTVAGAILGTPGYAAPEALKGEPTDARADVFALGAILFEILTLESLVTVATVPAMIAATLSGVDACASRRAPELEVPPELEALCVGATQLDPAARPASAREVHLAVERFLDGDRDLQMRRDQARQHAAAGARAAEQALGDSGQIADRKRALREIGRALALDPDNRDAAATLLQLLTTPPKQIPSDARAALDRAELESLRASSKFGAGTYATALLFMPLVLLMGVRSWPALGLGVGLMASCVIVALLLSRVKRASSWKMLALMVLSTVALSSATTLFGVYMVLPGMIATNAMAYAAHPRTLRGGVVILVSCLGLLVPAALQWVHVFPSYQFTDGIIRVLPWGMAFPAPATELFLLAMSLMTIIGASGYAVHAHRARAEAEERAQLQAWQLSQLV
jgi:serine/threonine-protein kinase